MAQISKFTTLLKKVPNKLEYFKRLQHANSSLTLDVEVNKGQGVRLWDKNGKEYLDFIGAHGSINAGHCHPKLINCMQEQMCLLHQTTQSINTNVLPEFAQYICQMFNYDRVITVNSGLEACEAAAKMARIWGYKVKKICPKDAILVFCNCNYWGCSLAAVSASCDPLLFSGFQPLLTGMKLIPYDDPCSLEEILRNPNVCGFMVEPLQCDCGVMVPQDGYLAEVRRLCTQHKVLWICNEVVTGLGRTGLMLGVDHECVKPDILVLGRSLAGGMYPVSAALASCEVMDLLRPGSHMSTFAGNPLGARTALAMLKLIKEECLCENAANMGALLRDGLLCTFSKDDMPILRGKGLLYACKIDPRIGSPMEITENLRDCGLLVWPNRDEFLRFTPPLVVSEEEITQAISIFKKVVDHMKGPHCVC
ncbi:ornithine aminotransferase, mitochondrial-like isoform X1 [Cimex lectularius]|uniref:Ornithine aminotransferase n=2 Tax=Cimex lectularius TaxID=79782 RepID=A0A8I6S053_CIMLE|nr:ornithine aminotransferase, mitochondrial-like isoform X1 [Cimex lectularius]